MDELKPVVSIGVKKRKITDYTVCFLCRTQSSEALLSDPIDSSFEKLVSCILNRSTWGDESCTDIKKSFGDGELYLENLKSNSLKWHRSCYQSITHKKKCKELQEKYMKSQIREEYGSSSTQHKQPLYDNSKCFFCDVGDNNYRKRNYTRRRNTYEKLSTVRTIDAGLKLRQAVELSADEMYRVKLNSACDPENIHGINVRYHLSCWVKNVTNKLHLQNHKQETEKLEIENNTGILSKLNHAITKVEFIGNLKNALAEGKVLSMGLLEEAYKSMCDMNDVEKHRIMCRKTLKKFIKVELADEEIEFFESQRANESQRLSLKCTRDALLDKAESIGDNMDGELNILYQAAGLIRKEIMKSESWNYNGSFPKDLVPTVVKKFFKWCIEGKNDISDSQEQKNRDIDKKVDILSQILISSCFSRRQIGNKVSRKFHVKREMPLQVAVGLTVHGTTRSKAMIEKLNGFGFSIDYYRVLRIETQIASAVLENMKANSGIYIPSDLIPNRFIHCAADNLDFSEDTPDGKRTLHGTVMTIYQCKEQSDVTKKIILKPSNSRSLRNANDAVPKLIPFKKPSNWTTCHPVSRSNMIGSQGEDVFQSSELSNFAWLLVRNSLLQLAENSCTDELADQSLDSRLCNQNPSPTWSSYMSLLEEKKPVTKVSILPLIPESPTQQSVQLTFMKQFEKVNSVIVGPNKKVVVTVDMALYKPLKQLEMAMENCQNKWVLKPGELHVIIAQLRTIGEFIAGSGIPELWIESSIYGSSTSRQILEGRHVRRSIQAHITTLSSLMILLIKEFINEDSSAFQDLLPIIDQLTNSIEKKDEESVRNHHSQLISILEDREILQRFNAFCNQREINEPMFKFACTYIDMVQIMLLFVKSVRSSDFLLSLASLKQFIKYFFAMDRHNYARMIALYLSEMKELEENEPDIWNEFMSGNWVVNRSGKPFCALGDDEALEHQNRRLKVQGGLTGITLNEQCRMKFFLTDTELSRIAEETNSLYGRSTSDDIEHRNSPSRQFRNTLDQQAIQLKNAFESTTNPFSCRYENLVQLVSQRVFPQDVQKDVTRVKEAGEEMCAKFVKERIETQTVPFWSCLKRLKLKMCSSSAKKIEIDLKGKLVEMKSNASLFSKLVIASRSRPEIDMKYCLSEFELSAVPKSLFNPDGSLHFCLTKYKLAHILENSLKNEEFTEESSIVPCDNIDIVAIIDGMAQLHVLGKPTYVKTCQHLAEYFCRYIDDKYKDYVEVHIVFDKYKVDSLKNTMRDHRQVKGRLQYKILPNTNLENTTMKKLLSHEKTKDELTAFLADHLIKYGSLHGRKFIVSWQGEAAATHTDVTMLSTTQEEADTKIILHGKYAAEKGVKTLHIYSPDSDVLILAVAKYSLLPKATSIYYGHGMKRFISLEPIHSTLGPLRASALLGLHALSGCDTTGGFVSKGKLTWWRAFENTSIDIVECLSNFGKSHEISPHTYTILERFICQVYIPNTSIEDIGEARWWLFTKKNYNDERLPPTRQALQPAIQRANLQALIWHQSTNQFPEIPSPLEHGWRKNDGGYEPIMSLAPCAPSFLLELSRCGCKLTRCNRSCVCVQNQLKCTEMCHCNGDPELCDNGTDINDEEDNVLSDQSDEESSDHDV